MNTQRTQRIQEVTEVDLKKLNTITEKIIGSAIEVHKQLGPGLLEQVYHHALCHEFDLKKIEYQREVAVDVVYKGKKIRGQKLDFIVERSIVIEIKSIEYLGKIHEAQLITYLRFSKKRLGLLINFNVKRLIEGVRRIIL
ncbi:GxxExxY protein [Candidatus Peregrinibacteria bacterium]|nr:GxxExxY protein [Candidatus Peregrinibacteria bacterium]